MVDVRPRETVSHAEFEVWDEVLFEHAVERRLADAQILAHLRRRHDLAPRRFRGARRFAHH